MAKIKPNCPPDVEQGPLLLGHLLGPDLRTSLCGIRLSSGKQKPHLITQEEKCNSAPCYACREIYEVLNQERKKRSTP